ncbi:MAG: NifB/NifX family molybdenum-iron cluster-binding protein [Anaerolineales bacterium]|jgi:predicted Fe-Mo cluster-binding NifX family protein|nr:NifB/NifX family molybdenum-iron cluster-binding protein [Anaerolineales bacterium]
MKIAFVTDDGSTISQHFGRAVYYAVLEIENGHILRREMRDKPNHKHFADQPHQHPTEPAQQHGFDPAAQVRHGQMAEVIADCEALICRGMGAGAYQNMQERGIRPIVTDIHSIEETALAYVRGELVDHVEKLH